MGYWGVEWVRGVLGVELRGEGGIWEFEGEGGYWIVSRKLMFVFN